MQNIEQDVKNHILNHLVRIDGQIRGIQKMVDQNRDCQEIIQQLSAIRSSIQSVSRTYVDNIIGECLRDSESSSEAKISRIKQLVDSVYHMK